MFDPLLKRKHIAFGILILWTIVIFGFRLHLPAEMYFDEHHHAQAARTLASSGEFDFVSVSHPPAWHTLTAGIIKLWGDHALSWRILSFLSGVICVILIFAIARRISGNFWMACLTSFFVTIDCISLTQARIAMLNAFVSMFMLLALWCFLQHVWDKKWSRQKAFLLTGFFWGLALGTKLSSVSMVFIFGGMTIVMLLKSKNQRLNILKDTLLFLIVLPIGVYFSCHWIIPFLEHYTLRTIWEMQVLNLDYHLNEAIHQTHPYSSRWWNWPLISRPIWYYFQTENYETPQAIVRGILCIGNPVIFWSIPLSIGWALWDALKNRSSVSRFIIFCFLTQWLFYALAKRLTYFHYFYYCMPFVAMALSQGLTRLWQWNKTGRILTGIYFILALGMFVYWYPLLTGMPVSGSYYGHHLWFKSWI